jgi:hypothetical protein
MARGDQLVHNFKPSIIPNFFVEAAEDGLIIQEHWGTLLLGTVSSGIFGDGAVPYETALRKLRMVRLRNSLLRWNSACNASNLLKSNPTPARQRLKDA